ncbi:MAG TPA: hypothetical protein VJT74_05455 [Pyrinomonadaceae bacterium]|nr:hypothetical protein [Pyrinomonadaceae bacterium]
MNAEAEAEALDILTDVIRVHAEPVIKAIIRHKLRVFLDGSGVGHAAQEAEDVESDVVLNLLTKLRELKADPRARAIGNFRSYVAVTTHHACHEVLRRKYPQRWRLKNRLRYLLTHHEAFALWGDENEDWLCGFSAWRERRLRAAEAGRLEHLRDAPRRGRSAARSWLSRATATARPRFSSSTWTGRARRSWPRARPRGPSGRPTARA